MRRTSGRSAFPKPWEYKPTASSPDFGSGFVRLRSSHVENRLLRPHCPVRVLSASIAMRRNKRALSDRRESDCLKGAKVIVAILLMLAVRIAEHAGKR